MQQTRSYNLVELYCEVEHETEKAILVAVEDKRVWLPKSVVELEDDMVILPEWLAFEKGLI